MVPLAANNRPRGHHEQAHRRKRHQHRHGQESTTIYERCGREAQKQGRDSMCLCRKASVQAKMLGNRRRADEKRFENFGTGNFGFYTPNFLSSFFLTQNINCESQHFSRDALPSEQKQPPWAAASHCNPGALGILLMHSVCSCTLTFGHVCVSV